MLAMGECLLIPNAEFASNSEAYLTRLKSFKVVNQKIEERVKKEVGTRKGKIYVKRLPAYLAKDLIDLFFESPIIDELYITDKDLEILFGNFIAAFE